MNFLKNEIPFLKIDNKIENRDCVITVVYKSRLWVYFKKLNNWIFAKFPSYQLNAYSLEQMCQKLDEIKIFPSLDNTEATEKLKGKVKKGLISNTMFSNKKDQLVEKIFSINKPDLTKDKITEESTVLNKVMAIFIDKESRDSKRIEDLIKKEVNKISVKGELSDFSHFLEKFSNTNNLHDRDVEEKVKKLFTMANQLSSFMKEPFQRTVFLEDLSTLMEELSKEREFNSLEQFRCLEKLVNFVIDDSFYLQSLKLDRRNYTYKKFKETYEFSKLMVNLIRNPNKSINYSEKYNSLEYLFLHVPVEEREQLFYNFFSLDSQVINKLDIILYIIEKFNGEEKIQISNILIDILTNSVISDNKIINKIIVQFFDDSENFFNDNIKLELLKQMLVLYLGIKDRTFADYFIGLSRSCRRLLLILDEISIELIEEKIKQLIDTLNQSDKKNEEKNKLIFETLKVQSI